MIFEVPTYETIDWKILRNNGNEEDLKMFSRRNRHLYDSKEMNLDKVKEELEMLRYLSQNPLFMRQAIAQYEHRYLQLLGVEDPLIPLTRTK